MATMVDEVERCPVAGVDRRKSAAVVGAGSLPGARPVTEYDAVRRVLRDPGARQAGFKADLVARFGSATRPPILYLSGAAHRRQRAATARFFAPRVVNERHRPIMEATSERLIEEFRNDGEARLDQMALDLAVTVAAEIVGLTESDKPGMIRRLDSFLSIGSGDSVLARLRFAAMGQARMLHFHLRDVRPAIAARRAEPREDVISHLIDEGYSERDILVECVTYGAAGMVTTREFVTMAGWHLLEDAALRDRFLAADRDGRLTILEEILRLEPVIGTLYRRVEGEDAPLALDVRAANADPQAVGGCPFGLDPDRPRAERVGGAGLAFGDGEHRCPGAGVALAEAEVFLDQLLRVPGIRLAAPPRMGWNALVTGYELRDCVLTVKPAP